MKKITAISCGPAAMNKASSGPMKVRTMNWPPICSVVMSSSTITSGLRASATQVPRSTGAPFSPRGSRHHNSRALASPSAPMKP